MLITCVLLVNLHSTLWVGLFARFRWRSLLWVQSWFTARTNVRGPFYKRKTDFDTIQYILRSFLYKSIWISALKQRRGKGEAEWQLSGQDGAHACHDGSVNWGMTAAWRNCMDAACSHNRRPRSCLETPTLQFPSTQFSAWGDVQGCWLWVN